MYKLAVKKDFIAQHFLIGGDWGPENKVHSHHYQIEVQLAGRDLDEHGFLVDIANINQLMEKLITSYRDKILNELPDFNNINPSIENLARIAYQSLRRSLPDNVASTLKIRVWEDEIAWVTYREG